MKVLEIDINKYLTTTIYDASPHRFKEEEKPVSERNLPVIFICENCGKSISFTTKNFEKHTKSNHTNLNPDDKELFEIYIKKSEKDYSFIDFYCPDCNQATTIIFNGGFSGYWGIFGFEIKNAFVIKDLPR